MSSPSFAEPVWRAPERGFSSDAVLDPGEEADVAIVGGGLQGLSTAYHLARRGVSVRVIEAGAIGGGASGLNGGQVIPGLKYDPDWLIENFGFDRGERLVRFAGSVADKVFDLISAEGLAVERMRAGWIQAAHTHEALERAAERNEQWIARAADVRLLNEAETKLMTGARGYVGGWLDRRAGVVNPLALTLELARIAAARGVRLLEGRLATGMKHAGGRWHVTLDDGSVLRAGKVVVATNAYSGALVPGLAESLVALHSFQIATAPLPPAQGDGILPHGQAVSDSRRILVYYRKSPDGRLVLGGRGRMGLPKSADDWKHLEHALLRLFPGIEGIAIEKRWFGRVAMTVDHLPHIHEPEPGLLVLAGCQGRGVGLMTAAGEPLADYLIDGDASVLPFAVSAIRPVPFHRFRRLGVTALVAWYRMLDGMER